MLYFGKKLTILVSALAINTMVCMQQEPWFWGRFNYTESVYMGSPTQNDAIGSLAYRWCRSDHRSDDDNVMASSSHYSSVPCKGTKYIFFKTYHPCTDQEFRELPRERSAQDKEHKYDQRFIKQTVNDKRNLARRKSIIVTRGSWEICYTNSALALLCLGLFYTWYY